MDAAASGPQRELFLLTLAGSETLERLVQFLIGALDAVGDRDLVPTSSRCS